MFEVVSAPSEYTGKVRFYWCGGTGLNNGVQFNPKDTRNVFVDTGRGNLVDDIPSNQLFITEKTAGAGGDRKYIYPLVKGQIATILDRFEPADFNVVIHSGSGGSGSVLGPLIHGKIKEAGKSVISVVVIDTDDNNKAIQNVQDTNKSYEGIGASLGLPPIIFPVYNKAGVSFNEINNEVIYAVESLAILGSQQNHRIDLKDVLNWSNYSSQSGTQPCLSALYIEARRADANTIKEPLAVISLYENPADEIPFGAAYSRKAGFSEKGVLGKTQQLHFVINTVGIDELVHLMDEAKVAVTRKLSQYHGRRSHVDVDDDLQPDGMVV